MIEIPDTLVIRLIDINEPFWSTACCINHEEFTDCKDCDLAYRSLKKYHNSQDQWEKGFHAGYTQLGKFIKHLENTIELLRKRKHYWRNKYLVLKNHGIE